MPPWPSCFGPRERELQEVRYGKQGSAQLARCTGDYQLPPFDGQEGRGEFPASELED